MFFRMKKSESFMISLDMRPLTEVWEMIRKNLIENMVIWEDSPAITIQTVTIRSIITVAIWMIYLVICLEDFLTGGEKAATLVLKTDLEKMRITT